MHDRLESLLAIRSPGQCLGVQGLRVAGVLGEGLQALDDAADEVPGGEGRGHGQRGQATCAVRQPALGATAGDDLQVTAGGVDEHQHRLRRLGAEFGVPALRVCPRGPLAGADVDGEVQPALPLGALDRAHDLLALTQGEGVTSEHWSLRRLRHRLHRRPPPC